MTKKLVRNTKLHDLLKFVEFTNLFASIYRKTILNKDGSPENDSQHSFQLALVAWYICKANKLAFNSEKLIKYALVHDLVETYSGSFPAYSRSKDKQIIKEVSEKKALAKITKDFSEFKELPQMIKDYNGMIDNESKFIYALDKFIPIINIELNNNDFYFQTQTTLEDMLNVKKDKIAKDKTVDEYFVLLTEYLNTETNFFWPDNKKRDYSKKQYF